MDRRSFLELFGISLVAAPLIINSELIDDEPRDEESAITPCPYIGIPYLVSCTAYGKADQSIPGFFELRRRSAILSRWYLNAYGGLINWIPKPGSEFYHLPEHPITIYSSTPEIEAYACIRNPGINNFTMIKA